MEALEGRRSAGAGDWVRIVAAPAAVVLLHALLAAVLGHRREFDPAFHFLGGVAGAYALLRATGRFPGLVNPVVRRHESLWLVGLVLGIALFWEAAELASDLVVGTHIQRGLTDTGTDVALGVAGAVVVAAVAAISARRQ